MNSTHIIEHTCSSCSADVETDLRRSIESLLANVSRFIEADGCAVTFICERCGSELTEVEVFSQVHPFRNLRPLLWSYGVQVADLWSCAEASMANGCYAAAESWGPGEFEQFIAMTLAAKDLTHMPEDSYDATMVLEVLKKSSPKEAGALVSVFLTQVQLADFSPYEDFVFLVRTPEALEAFMHTLSSESELRAMRDALKTYDDVSTDAELDAYFRLQELLQSPSSFAR